jgi:hypothetical protein
MDEKGFSYKYEVHRVPKSESSGLAKRGALPKRGKQRC